MKPFFFFSGGSGGGGGGDLQDSESTVTAAGVAAFVARWEFYGQRIGSVQLLFYKHTR